jgi:hypothetical protein
MSKDELEAVIWRAAPGITPQGVDAILAAAARLADTRSRAAVDAAFLLDAARAAAATRDPAPVTAARRAELEHAISRPA